jgi:hypothetical protein
MPQMAILALTSTAALAAAAATGATGSSETHQRQHRSRIKLGRALTGGGPWRLSRVVGAEDAGTPLAWHIGMNHPEAYWQPCDPQDAECLRADLFRKLYQNNKTTAALAQLPLYDMWNFTAAGYDSPPEHMERLPFMHLTMPMSSGGSGPSSWAVDIHFPDVWNASVRAGIVAKATAACEEIRPHRHNLIGYIWTDTPAFDVGYAQAQRGTDWVTAMRCLPADAPGRQAYMAWLKERFAANISRVCSAYSVPRAACAATATWEHLDLCPYKNTATPAMMADDDAFMPTIVRTYLSHLNATIKACDPEGNVFTDTIRSTWTPDNVIEVIGEFADAISYQPDSKYFNLTEMERVHHVSGGKPLLIADIGFAFPHPPYGKQEWNFYESQQAAGAAYKGFAIGSAKSGFIVGL